MVRAEIQNSRRICSGTRCFCRGYPQRKTRGARRPSGTSRYVDSGSDLCLCKETRTGCHTILKKAWEGTTKRSDEPCGQKRQEDRKSGEHLRRCAGIGRVRLYRVRCGEQQKPRRKE